MKTGYFGKLKSYPKDLRFVSIARFCKFWTGERYLALAPLPDMFGLGEEEYKKQYAERILAKLDPKKVYEELFDAVILCYEKWEDIKSDKTFCHRHLVAKWLEKELGVNIDELC